MTGADPPEMLKESVMQSPICCELGVWLFASTAVPTAGPEILNV